MSFVNEKPIKAVRKPHRCEVCPAMIEVGESAVNWAGLTDGDFMSVYYHPDCRAAEIAYNEMTGGCWDEWYCLAYGREDDDDAWLFAEHPSVAGRLGITSGGRP